MVSVLAFVSVGDARGIDLGRLVMPGPLIADHARWENECGRCHRPLEQGGQDALCLDCHEEIEVDVKAGTGFHGRSPAVSGASACRSCHPDHRGREADVVGLLTEIFDHGFTDFRLEGAHGSVPCTSCHPPEDHHREAGHDCLDCHREDDPHGDSLGDDCAECHEPAGWRRAKFDHDDTDFPLRGAHQSVACQLCHPGLDASAAPTDCVGCHRLDDAHRGGMGPDCGECHGTVRWSQASFDHDRDTKFPLEGAHERADCVACHAKPPEQEETSRDCVACHRSQDVHAGRNGSECGTCHGFRKWDDVIFDHAKDTEFALEGAHAALRCTQCHGTSLEGMKASPVCVDCHGGDDVHGGQLEARCDLCHTSRSWSHEITFEHDVVRFPLLGLHATASCEQCHVSRHFEGTDPSCTACHTHDDAHDGALGSDCGRCHGPNGWPLWEFDHSAETSFALHGAHEDLACSSCHRSGTLPSAVGPGRCVFCHADDDVHFGAFGESCETCHVDDDWQRVRLRR